MYYPPEGIEYIISQFKDQPEDMPSMRVMPKRQTVILNPKVFLFIAKLK